MKVTLKMGFKQMFDQFCKDCHSKSPQDSYIIAERYPRDSVMIQDERVHSLWQKKVKIFMGFSASSSQQQIQSLLPEN